MPAYASVRAIENKEESGKKDQQQWTIYWMVYAMINMAENLLPFDLNCIPNYGWIRIAILLQVSTVPSTTLYLFQHHAWRVKNWLSEFVQEQIRKAAAAKKAEEEAAKVADNSKKNNGDEPNVDPTESPQKGGRKKLAGLED